MKSIIKNVLFFIVVILLFDFIIFKARTRFGGASLFYVAEVVVYFILLFLFFMSILYKKVFTFKSGKVKVIIVLAIVFIASYQLSGRMVAINKSYYIAKYASVEISPGIWKFDQQLAHAGTPYASGAYTYFIGDTITGSIPVLIDSLGYRTVPDSLKLRSAGKDLFLGCSWTFGDFVIAEHTYPYLVAKGLGHSYLNAGISGYGLGQMYIIANKMVPKEHFEHTFIQLSPWLADRAMALCGPTAYGYWPYPYFSNDKDRKFKVNFPAFCIKGTDEHEWNKTKASYPDKWHFAVTMGLPVEIADYYSYNFVKMKTLAGLAPTPTKDKEDIECYFYNYMIDFCRANNTKPVIIKFGYDYPNDGRATKVLKSLEGKVSVIDLDSVTHGIIPGATAQQYSKMFHIWHVTKAGDSLLANGHPNGYIHKLYADKIISVLNEK